jgi:putative N6-adenine-specific DNA methylase
MKNSTTATSEKLTERGLERRIKRHLSKQTFSYLATTTPGFENVLKEELKGIENTQSLKPIDGGVEFSGPLDLIYIANLTLRSANRVLLRIDAFVARSYPELFNKIVRINWELFIGFNKKVSFKVSSRNSRLHHTGNIENSVFEGVQSSMAKLGVSIENTPDAPVRIFVRFFDDNCTLSIDSSGELLYKRGYRTEVANAPMRESVAAAILLGLNIAQFDIIADPMCGSGVFVFESAMILKNHAPGSKREFSFSQWPSFNAEKYERFRNKSLISENKDLSVKLIGSDINANTVASAKLNCKNLSLNQSIELLAADCLEFNKTREMQSNGLVVSNLPYGKRVGELDALNNFYKKFGVHFRNVCKGWTFALIAADNKFPQHAKLNIVSKIQFENGGIPVTCFIGKF